MRSVICLVGLPASGKSHFAQILSKKLNYPSVELDKHFESDYKQEKSSRLKVFNLAVERLKDETCKGLIIDDLNHLKSIRHFWFMLSTHFNNVAVVFISLDTNIGLCRDRNRRRCQPVSDMSFEKIVSTFEQPGGEYFEQNHFEWGKNHDFLLHWTLYTTSMLNFIGSYPSS